ncbi:protein rotatin homolog [Malaya genurostris]|uniref:protein rotatin homolog n=1 Tax=Malaya genurostris TaxID=325434 RepID=UPI0026F3B91E|nr:protein rotatin homolog [Malaya genurostris]
MTLVITQEMLDKLNHEIHEIRIRTLHDVENKVKQSLWQSQDLKFKPTSLVKNLIRWFGNVPISEETAVLELLSLLLKSKHGPNIVNHFTSNRLLKELGKIKYLIGSNHALSELVDNIVQQVHNVQQIEQIQPNPESIAESLASLKVDCIDLTASPRESVGVNQEQIKRNPNYYTKCWEVPLSSDAKTLRELNSSLQPDGDEKDIHHAYSYLVPSINDYPAEFFLQPPYIFHSLVKLLEMRKASIQTTVEIFHRLTMSIQKRLKSLELTSMYTFQNHSRDGKHVQISVSAYVHELFLLGIVCLKEISDNPDLQDSNKIFNLFYELIELGSSRTLEKFLFLEIRHELGFLAKHFRQNWEANSKCFSARTKYLVTINIMSTFLRRFNPAEHVEHVEPVVDDTCFPHKPHNPAELETINSINHLRSLGEGDRNWFHELQIAALDYPMKHMYPSIYEPVLQQALREDNRKLQILLSADEIFASAVSILRQPAALSDEELIFRGLEAIDTLYLHRSVEMAKLMIKAVGNCYCFFEGNPKLKEAAEKLVLRLLSHTEPTVKCAAYDQCNNVIKEFISCLDEGAILTHRRSFPKMKGKLHSLGIPLTVEILVEVICFGCSSVNEKIQQRAETILLFVLNSRTFLLDRWIDLLDIILPVMPLLQTVAISKKHSTLSRAIIGLLHPDSGLPMSDLIRGNLRFLFQDDTDLREEALTRVLFIISGTNNSQHYSPNIEHIRDTISNAICLVKSKYDVAKHLSNDVYELSAIKPLLDTLEQENSDPAIRRSTLIQLNLMAEDPCLCEIMHQANGWAFVLKALDNALREEHSLDYPDSAVPAIGILTKLCFSIPEFSRFLADNVNVFNLVIRALLAYHHLPVFKKDCCSLLFLLLFSGYTTGCGKAISLPAICNYYSIPYVCEFHWKCSPFNEMSLLEEIFLERVSGIEETGFSALDPMRDNSVRMVKRTCGIECATSWSRNNVLISNESLNQTNGNFGNMDNYRQVAWRFLRLAFACQWFDAFENILVNSQKCRQSPNTDRDRVLDYSILPPHLVIAKHNEDGEIIDLDDHCLQFDQMLKITRTDINMIKTSHVDDIFRNNLKNIASASSHAEVSIGLSGLECNLILPMQEQIMHNSIVKHLKKFILTSPNTPADERLLIAVIGLLGDLIQIGYENVLVWIVTLLFEQTSVFIQLLKSDTCSSDLFMRNADFIKITLQEALSCENPNVTCLLTNEKSYQMKIKKEHNFNLLNKLFEIIIDRLDTDLQKCDLLRILSLIGLARVVIHSGLIEFDSKFFNHVVNKLCSYINLIRSITYSGSTITKNCLLIMSFILDQTKEVHLKAKNYRVLSMQCSHTSTLIRSCTWNVLAKIAKSLSGAHSIIKECGYLPGGIHACCINTLLDPEEAGLVKESAAGLLINLLTHRLDKDGPLHKFMLPFDKESNCQLDADPLQTVLVILRKYRFVEQALESLQCFTTLDDMSVEELDGVQIVTCDVVKSYSMIFSSLLDLKPQLMDVLVEKCCLQRLMNCVSKVPLHPSRSAFRMVSEICNLLQRCLKISNEEICELITQYQAVIGGIVYLLNPTLYNDGNEDIMYEVTSNIMNLLFAFTMHKIGHQLIIYVLTEFRLEPLVQLIVQGVSKNERKDYQIVCLRFLTMLIIASGVPTASISESTSFLGLMETVRLDSNEDIKQSVGNRSLTGKDQCIKPLERVYNGFSSDDDQENQNPNSRHFVIKSTRKELGTATYTTGAELIFATLIEQFRIVTAKDKPENGALVSTLQKRTLYSAIQVFLHRSEIAKRVARSSKFLDMLIERLECVYNGIGLSYQDFVRKNGENKKAPIVAELSSIAGMLSAWFQNDILVHQANIFRICKLFLQLWPWISNNRDMENEFMKALVCLTEKSIIVCRSLPITYPGHPHSILKLTIAIATAETGRVKGPNCELTLLRLCLRILINCCACQEGRTVIAKFNVLDNISKLHPVVTKLQKPWVSVTKLWLEFWEIYTRHNDVTAVKNLTVLGALIRKSTPELRRLSLEIMRNMSFVTSNRAALLASNDYMHALKVVLDGTETTEQMIVISSIWKVIANNHKGKSAIKSTPIPRRLSALLKQRSLLEQCEEDDLYNSLSIVVQLLYT